MSDAILVLNAGSSSIKFSVFVQRNGGLDLALRGQAEGLYNSPRFVAKNADGAVISEKSWGDAIKLGHHGAIDHLRQFLRESRGAMTLIGVGHRVAHGGMNYFEPVRVDKKVLN